MKKNTWRQKVKKETAALKPDSVSRDLKKCVSCSQSSVGEQGVSFKGERPKSPSDRVAEPKQVSIYHTAGIHDVYWEAFHLNGPSLSQITTAN